MSIVYCLLNRGRHEEFKRAVLHHCPFFDKSYIVLHQEYKENLAFLESDMCKDFNLDIQLTDVPYHPPTLRNLYLNKLTPEDWALQLDVDEVLELPALYLLPEIVKKAEADDINMLCFNAFDITTGLDGNVSAVKSNYFNPNFFKVGEGTEWRGETHGGIFRPNVPNKAAKVPMAYYHIKKVEDIWIRGCRNYWSTGEVAQNNQSVPEWQEFKDLCNKHGLSEFHEMFDLMSRGNIPEEFKQWFILQRDSENSEARSWFVTYFVFLHPEENIGMVGNIDFLYDKDREPRQGLTF